MKPFFSFYGGKWRCAPHYPSPRHSTIIEPFAGSAGFSIRYADRDVILVEKDPIISETWRYLIAASPEDILALPDLEEGKTPYDLGVPTGAQYLIGWWLQRGGTGPNRTLSAWGRNPRYAKQFWGPHARNRVASQVDKIKHWRLIEGDYTSAPDIEATWFIDPPYQRYGKHYRHSSLDYARLSDWCRTRKGQAIVCENVGARWLPFEPWRDIKANESKTGGKVSKEAIWLGGTE